MKKRVEKMWLDALESGKYKQTQGTLCDIEGKMCCLGVLTDLYIRDTKKGGWCGIYPVFYGAGEEGEDGADSVLHPEVMKWAGLKSESGDFKDGKTSLVELNDTKKYSFKKIAKAIRENKIV